MGLLAEHGQGGRPLGLPTRRDGPRVELTEEARAGAAEVQVGDEMMRRPGSADEVEGGELSWRSMSLYRDGDAGMPHGSVAGRREAQARAAAADNTQRGPGGVLLDVASSWLAWLRFLSGRGRRTLLSYGCVNLLY